MIILCMLGCTVKPQMAATDWESPHLVSVIVMREPISRALARDARVNKKYPNILQGNGTASVEEWWRFARDDTYTDNFALCILSGYKCCQGADTDSIHLEHAMALVRRFTFVLDIECLDAGMLKLAEVLGIGIGALDKRSKSENRRHKQSPRERIGYSEVYKYLIKKNQLDIELYEWSKRLALVNCSALAEEQANSLGMA